MIFKEGEGKKGYKSNKKFDGDLSKLDLRVVDILSAMNHLGTDIKGWSMVFDVYATVIDVARPDG